MTTKRRAQKTVAEPLPEESLRGQLSGFMAALNPSGMSVTSCQVYVLNEPMGKTLALARVVLNDQMQLTGLRLVNGANGLFVSYPNDPSYKGGDFRSLFYPVTKGLREHIMDVVIGKYRETLALERG